MPEFEKSRNHRDRKPREEAPARPDWQQRVDRPANPDKAKSPLIPNDIQPEDLEMGVRVQLKTLTAENAERVARHLAMVSILWDQDPQLAHRHAQAAADRAGRIAVVRETLAVTAYLVEDWALALREFLTHRRMTASNEHLAMMVDCERGLGRPKRALELGRSVDRASLTAEVRVNLAIACSGARLDLGETELALAELEIKELDPSKVFEFTPPLFWAYSETLSALGRNAEADKWRDLATRADAAIAAKFAPAEESLEVIEEIEIPKAADFVRRDGDAPRSGGFKRDGDRPRTGGFKRDGDRPRTGGFKRDGDAPRSGGYKRDGDAPRSGGFKRDGDAPRSGGYKRDGDHPGPDARPGGPRSSGPRSGGPRSSGPRPGGTRPGGSRPGGPRSGGSRPGGSRGR